MPLYEYQCAQCGRFEIIKKFSDPPLLTCPTCGCEVQKLLSAPAIQFKGTGWYITDYARKGGGSEGEKKGSEGEKKGGGKDSGKEGAQESGKGKESSPDSGKGESSSDGTSTKPTTSKASSG